MKTSKQIREEIAARHDRVDAIVALATEEKREFSADEQAEIDRIQGKGDDGGEIGALNVELERILKIENRQKQIAAQRLQPALEARAVDTNGSPRIVIPAQARRYGKLTAFIGNDGGADAYSCGQWWRANFSKDEDTRANAAAWCNQHGLQIKAVMTVGTNTAGGFLVPAPMEASIIRLLQQYGLARQKMFNKTMTADTDTTPTRTGGLTVYYPAEAGTITASQPSYGVVKLVAKKSATLSRISSELSEDAIISVMDELTTEIAYGFSLAEDNEAFLGDGTSTYGGEIGLITAVGAGSTVTAATGNTAFSTLDDQDFLDMIGKLPQYAGISPEWYISKAGFYASMGRLITAAGGVSKPNMEEDIRPIFHGYPVNFAQVMNSTLSAQTSTSGLCYFGDFRMGGTFGIRRGITVAADSSVYFATDETAVRATQRTNIKWHSVGDASNAGAVVMLKTPAS